MRPIGDFSGRAAEYVARKLAEAEERTLRGEEPITGNRERFAPKACAVCRGARFLRKDVPVEHAEFGRLVPCPACNDAVWMQTKASELLMAPALRGMTFARYTVRDAVQHTALGRAKAFAAHPFGWLYLVGGPGTGKTHLAAAIAFDLIERGTAARFVSAVSMAEAFRKTAMDEMRRAALLSEHGGAAVLILDDYGAENRSEYTDRNFAMLLEERYNYARPTVITSNVHPEDLPDPRLASRLGDRRLVEIVPTFGLLDMRRED